MTRPRERTAQHEAPRALSRIQPGLAACRDGQVVYELKKPFSDGTTHVVLEPLEFIGKLAALVPRPRVNLTRYHGVFAPRARHRRRVVPAGKARASKRRENKGESDSTASRARRITPMSWMQRLDRVFAIDLSQCPWCGAALRVIGEVTDPPVVARILAHIAARESGQCGARGPPASGAGLC